MKSTFTLVLITLLNHFTSAGSPVCPSTSEFAEFRSNLYIVAPDKSPVLMDGTLTQFDAGYSNAVDGMDARKMSNLSENFGMLRGNTVLIIERRKTIVQSDTIFFKMWNMRIINYRLELSANNLNTNGRIGLLKDNYLNTVKPIDLNGTTFVDFAVTSDPATKAADRFSVIFSTASFGILPLTFTATNAYPKNNVVAIDWNTANEKTLLQYEVEKSGDGSRFEKLSQVTPGNNTVNSYRYIDAHPADGNNFYRIRSVDMDGKVQYSNIMKVYINKGLSGLSVYPNPAVGNNFNLQLTNQPAGVYEVKLTNTFGQPFITKTIQHSGGNLTINLKPGSVVPKGIYQLEVQTATGEKKVISVIF